MRSLSGLSWRALSFPAILAGTTAITVFIPPAAASVLFGALTGVGQGGTASTATDGTYGEFTVSGGVITPNVTPLTVGTVTVGSDTIEVVADEASATDAELLTVYNAAATSLSRIGVRPGTGVTARRTLPAKAFTDLTIEAYGHAFNADPRLSIRPVLNGGLLFEAGASNVTITGMSFYTLTNSHMMGRDITGTITNCHYYDCEAAGENFYTMWNDNRMNSWNEQSRIGGVFSSSMNCSVKQCYVHDVHRGLSEGGSTGIVWENNYVLHVYQNFTNNVSSTGGTIRGNRCQHVWGANTDINDPHTAAGGSFGQQCVNMTIEDNWLDGGFARAELHNEHFLAGTLPVGEANTPYPTQGATGLKMNEDGAPIHPNYSGCVIRNNLINTRGLALQIEGGLNCTINNNTVVTNTNISGGSSAVIGIAGMDSCEMWNNVVSDYSIGANDASGGYVRSLDDLRGYFNLAFINTPVATMFAGHPTKGFDLLSIDELGPAYLPLVGTVFATHGVGYQASADTFVMPVATGGTSATFPATTWDGTAYVSRSSSALGGVVDGKRLLLKFRGTFAASRAGVLTTLVGGRSDRVQWIKTTSDTMELYIKDTNNSDQVFKMRGTQVITTGAVHDIAFGVNLANMSYFIAVDGVVDPLCSVSVMDVSRSIDSGSNLFRAFASKATTPADYFVGDVEHLYMTDDYIDGNTAAGLSAIFTADGGSRDYGVDGSGLTGTIPRLYLSGTAAGFSNTGSMGDVVINGTITNAGEVVNNAPVAVDDSLTVPFNTATVINVLSNDTDADADTLSVTAASSPNGAVVIEADSTLTFTPTTDFSGATTIAYTVSDGTATDTGSVAVTVQAAPAGPATIGMNGVSVDLNGLGIGNERTITLALRLTRTEDGYLFNSGTASSDSRLLLRAPENDYYLTLETSTGSRLFTGLVGGAIPNGTTASVFMQATDTGGTVLIVDGVTIISDPSTFSFVKACRYLFTGDGGISTLNADLHGGFWVSNDTPAYSDLFDGNNLPLWTGTTLGAFTAIAAPTTAAEINALAGTSGTAT